MEIPKLTILWRRCVLAKIKTRCLGLHNFWWIICLILSIATLRTREVVILVEEAISSEVGM